MLVSENLLLIYFLIYRKVQGGHTRIPHEKIRKVKLSGETIYTCDDCPKTYLRKSNIKKHIQMKHAPPMIPTQTSESPIALEAPNVPTNQEKK